MSDRRSRKHADLVLTNGALVEIKLGKDVQGNPVISQIEVFFETGKPIPSGGITAKTLKEISVNAAYSQKLVEQDPWKFNETAKKRILKYARQDLGASGRSGYPIEYYACLAYLYVEQFAKTPHDPTTNLAEVLGVPKRTLVNRLAMARKSGLLTAQSADGRSGRAGGTLTMAAELLLLNFFEDSHKKS